MRSHPLGAVVLAALSLASTGHAGAQDRVVPAPPPPVTVVAPVVYAPAPLPPVSVAERMPDAMPFMLGFGLSVLGGFTLAATTAILVDADLSGLNAEGGVAIGFTYLFGAAFTVTGVYLALGSLLGEVDMYSHQPGWAWFAAITACVGGLSTIAAVTTYFVDDDFGPDSLGFGIAAGAMYLLSLTALIGLDKDGGTTVSLAPAPLPGGAGVSVAGEF